MWRGLVLAQQLPCFLVQQAQGGVEAGSQGTLPILAEADAGDGAWKQMGICGCPGEDPPTPWEPPMLVSHTPSLTPYVVGVELASTQVVAPDTTVHGTAERGY